MRMILAGAGLLVLAAVVVLVIGLAQARDAYLWWAVAGCVLAGALLVVGRLQIRGDG